MRNSKEILLSLANHFNKEKYTPLQDIHDSFVCLKVSSHKITNMQLQSERDMWDLYYMFSLLGICYSRFSSLNHLYAWHTVYMGNYHIILEIGNLFPGKFQGTCCSNIDFTLKEFAIGYGIFIQIMHSSDQGYLFHVTLIKYTRTYFP